MRKNIKKSIAVIACIIAMGTIGGNVCYAQPPIVQNAANDGVAPCYLLIESTYNKLSLKTGGMLQCTGETFVFGGNYASVNVELQQYSGGEWNTIKTWYKKGYEYAIVDQGWFVEKGYDYRLLLTHASYDSNGNLAEITIETSKTVHY